MNQLNFVKDQVIRLCTFWINETSDRSSLTFLIKVYSKISTICKSWSVLEKEEMPWKIIRSGKYMHIFVFLFKSLSKALVVQPYICGNQMTELHVISVGSLVSGEESSVPYVKPWLFGFFKNGSSSAAVHDKEGQENVQWERKAGRERWNWVRGGVEWHTLVALRFTSVFCYFPMKVFNVKFTFWIDAH